MLCGLTPLASLSQQGVKAKLQPAARCLPVVNAAPLYYCLYRARKLPAMARYSACIKVLGLMVIAALLATGGLGALGCLHWLCR